MLLEIFTTSLVIALVFLPLLAWKWCIKIRVAIWGGVIIGGLTGGIVVWINSLTTGLNIGVLIVIELCIIFMMVFIVIATRFYRDPERIPKETERVILSPADGTVVYVNNVEKGSSLVCTKGKTRFKLKEIMSTDLLEDAVYLIGIDMNIFNVHVNRSPIDGNVVFSKRTRGKFISLRRQESEIMNERVTTVISNSEFKVGVIQISSRLVRRITSYIKEGDHINIGQRLGAIIFGSQVDVAVPELASLDIQVKPGDEVKAGVTVIARY